MGKILLIIGIIGIFTIPFTLGTFFGMSLQNQEPKIEFKYINTTEIKYVNNCDTKVTPIVTITQSPISTPSKYSDKLTYPYGGIPTSINYPPNGAVISKNLTENNNNHTIAVDISGNKYYFVGAWGWFNQSEYDALPYKNKLYDVSPYYELIDN